jgi:phage gp29-like protein
MWDTTDSKAVIRGIEWIHAKKAVFYERGAANMWQKSYEVPRVLTEAEPINGEIMPPFKLVYHRYKARSGYDTRAGVLRVCAWMYLFKNYSIKDWSAFAEVFGMPLRLGRYDPGASKEDKDALYVAIRSLGSDAAGIISKNTEIEFVETVKNAGTNNIYEALASFCDKQMSKAILGQTATTEGTPGKLGNEDAQDKVRHDLIKADAETLSSKAVRHQIIRPLVGYNFGWDKPLPWFNFLYEKPEDLEKLMKVYQGASEIGQPISQEHVSARFKIPLPQKSETVLKAAPKATPGGGNDAVAAKLRVRKDDRPGARVVTARVGQIAPEGEIDAADYIADALSTAAAPITDDLMSKIAGLVESASSMEDIRDGIIDLYGQMDPADLGAIIARAMAIAQMAGMTDIHDETGV